MRRHDLVVKTDTIVSGVHFLADEKPELVAAKALRVCLSDLAAGGATPFTSISSRCRLRSGWTERWVAGFARGLAADQRRFGIVLCGGDTTGTPGPTHGHHHRLRPRAARQGLEPRRRAGGRRALGERHDRRRARSACWRRAVGLTSAALEKRYRLTAAAHDAGPAPGRHRQSRQPTSPTACWPMPATSPMPRGSRFMIERERVPLSAGARRALAATPALWANVLGGGDDYELAIAVPPRKQSALLAAARAAGVKVTQIGAF